MCYRREIMRKCLEYAYLLLSSNSSNMYGATESQRLTGLRRVRF
jgi:hypothetical protein